MKFLADFHIHSRYSRATSPQMTLESMYVAAQRKGISILGTGDFTHPKWFQELQQKLVPEGNGLFRLRPDVASYCNKEVPTTCRGPVWFLLVTEVSNIYKKNNILRKNHNLIFVPKLDDAAKLSVKLEKLGKIASDGRPVLGMDARNLLETVLECGGGSFLVPAHIWTPWFSLLGSKSGFNSLIECFEDLSTHIFAVETGLSSDPGMNRCVEFLNRITLISNSDAHSPEKIGREANKFDTEASFKGIRQALKYPERGEFVGTLEFFPEEGKYHFDGHRKCGICFHPSETRRHQGICPVCGKPLTLGVLNRVCALSGPTEVDTAAPLTKPFFSSVPLLDILSEIYNRGPATVTVKKQYDRILRKLGPEYQVLEIFPLEYIHEAGIPFLPEAVQKIRSRDIQISPGFDGEFGKIRLFGPEERKEMDQRKIGS